MSLKADSEGKSYDDINVTPMVDLYLVLLLIFIIMTTAGIQGVKVNLPKASNTPSLAKPKTKAITVNNEGKVFLDTVPVTLDELATKLQAAKAQVPDLPVVIKGDSLTQYQGVMDVLNVVGNCGITQVGLATKSKDQK
jgi:biopolymer transport protein ExbD